MDLSFYDHPPMVAWLIWLGIWIFGDNEFGVRISALLCGLITMGYLYALTRNLYDKPTAIRAVLLLAVLPFYFSTGAVMTADVASGGRLGRDAVLHGTSINRQSALGMARRGPQHSAWVFFPNIR